MISKKLLLLSASMLLLAGFAAQAQKPVSPTTPEAPLKPVSPVAAIIQGGGNYLGVSTEEVTRENMGRYNLREPRGLAITRVAEESPAARAGLKTGDVILRFDGEQVTTVSKLQRLLNEAAAEQTVRLVISRNGAEQELPVTLGRRKFNFRSWSETFPAQPNAESRRALEDLERNRGAFGFGWGRRLGVNTTQLTRQLADYFGVAGGRGLLVTSVSENSAAARAGLKAGDVITAVDGETVANSLELSRLINRKAEGTVTLTVTRERNQITLTATPEKREPGSLTISPEILPLEPMELELAFPSTQIRLPEIKRIRPRAFPRITIPQIKITPEQFRNIEPLLEMGDTL